MPKHEWRVTLRNDKQGFVKTKTVDAVGYSQAITWAMDELAKDGYKPYPQDGEFEVVEIKRGKAV